ncbi:bifunctional adenosylcobinamide kinase/adenosylcobinamide-phosphate guanylyltransferase [Salininema proteolyticum]|uniref:Aminotransferase n=1 Tax=Salininema proteolyticum TaxID=1607685 RepID=A0ABV8U5P3_9ACTN
MTLTYISGATRSGKSAHAESLARASGRPVVYLATGRAADEEMRERIELHRARRPASWRTVETADLSAALDTLDPSSAVLVDDLDGWMTARMDARGMWGEGDHTAARKEILAEARTWIGAAASRPGPVFAVGGQPGWGLLPLDAPTRAWVDLHGEVATLVNQSASEALLLVHGSAVPLPRGGGESGVEPPPVGEETPSDDEMLADHGDTQVPDGCVDLAVNVEPGPPPWLAERLIRALPSVNGYPKVDRAQAAAAARHRRSPSECVVLNGSAEGFELVARAVRPHRAVVVHPTFTEGEAALRRCGVPVERVFRDPRDWSLRPEDVPESADLVLLTRPDNPTGALDPVSAVEALTRPGRTVVVDEAFIDFLPELDELASRGDLPGLVTLRSMTKMWGIAGLRAGYATAPEPVAATMRELRQPWSVNTLAAEALIAVCGAEQTRRGRAEDVAARREYLYNVLKGIAALEVWPGAANYLLIRSPLPDLRERLIADGFAPRRGETFPGLDRRHLRLAVRTEDVSDALAAAVNRHLRERT